MGRHKSNHIQVAYANGAEEADRALLAKGAMAHALGMRSRTVRNEEKRKGLGLRAGFRTMWHSRPRL